MNVMENLDLKEIRKTMEENREILIERLMSDTQEKYTNRPFTSERSDLAMSYDQEQRNELLLTQAREQLADVEAALQRLDNGTYGKCLDCERSINPERLRALPSAALCIRCQEQQE